MSGHARSFGAGIVLPLTLIQGSSVAGSGGSLDVPSLTLSMRGVAAARGALLQRTFLVGSGGAMSSGKTIMSPWHFIVPDETGEPLSTLTELPTFSPALVTDQDYYVFDWGERAGVASDPIVAATVTATPNTISVGAPEIVGDQVRVLVGGTVVGTYALRCAVTLRSGRVLHWSVPVQIEKV